MSEIENPAHPMSYSDCLVLATIVQAALDEAPVARVRPTAPGTVLYGTARALLTTGWERATQSDDVRDLCLQVTVGIGDQSWPLRELLPEIKEGYFVVRPHMSNRMTS